MKAFDGMGLADIKNYHKNVEEECRNYLNACRAFEEEPSLKHWDAYTQHYSGIYAALWMSFFWRMYLKKESSSVAHRAGVSIMVYEAMLSNYQARMQSYEEDHHFTKDICNLAAKVGGRVSKPPTVQKVLDVIRDSDFSSTQHMIRRLARDYRIGKNEDICNDYPV